MNCFKQKTNKKKPKSNSPSPTLTQDMTLKNLREKRKEYKFQEVDSGEGNVAVKRAPALRVLLQLRASEPELVSNKEKVITSEKPRNNTESKQGCCT